MKIQVSTRGGKSVPWPPDEAPPRRDDSVRWNGETWVVIDVRWDLEAWVCYVTISPAVALYEDEARKR